MNNITSLPEEFVKRLELIVDKNKYNEILDTFCINKPTTFRVNNIKSTVEEIIHYLSSNGFELETVSWSKNALILKNKSQKELTETNIYKQGEIYLQNLSSMIPALVLNPMKHERVLDIAAAPGSKTTQMAALMENTGEIVANDMSKIRLYKLHANLKLQGANNVIIEHMRGQVLWKKYYEYFDKALVDVPCSLEGTFNCNYPKSYMGWSIRKIKKLAEYQKYILRSAISSTKKGGTIVYSTCTLAPEENESVIDWIVKKENVEIEKVELPNFDFNPPILTWQNKDFINAKNTARILPTNCMEAFFIAKLRKM